MRRWLRLSLALTLLVVSLGLATVRPEIASASPGSLTGPIPGRQPGSILPKLGVNGQVVAFETAVYNFDPPAPTSPLLMGVYVRDRSIGVEHQCGAPVVAVVGMPDGIRFRWGCRRRWGRGLCCMRRRRRIWWRGDSNGKSGCVPVRSGVGDDGAGVGGVVVGSQGLGGRVRGAMSADPRYVAFVSTAGLVAGRHEWGGGCVSCGIGWRGRRRWCLVRRV